MRKVSRRRVLFELAARGVWEGYITGNRVKKEDVVTGRGYGLWIQVRGKKDLENYCSMYLTGSPERGDRIRFWEV